jgi:hypothetical protein
MSTTNKFCSTCKFLDNESKSCYRYPVPIPNISLSHWCGEWCASDKIPITEHSPRERAHLMLNAWNEAITNTRNCNLHKAIELTEKRIIRCNRRLEERPFEDWEIIFRMCAESPFLNGNNDRKWAASFNWIIEGPDNGLKVLEGRYTPVKKEDSHYGND